MADTSGLTAEEVVQKVNSGELQSCTYSSFSEFVMAMEE